MWWCPHLLMFLSHHVQSVSLHRGKDGLLRQVAAECAKVWPVSKQHPEHCQLSTAHVNCQQHMSTVISTCHTFRWRRTVRESDSVCSVTQNHPLKSGVVKGRTGIHLINSTSAHLGFEVWDQPTSKVIAGNSSSASIINVTSTDQIVLILLVERLTWTDFFRPNKHH